MRSSIRAFMIFAKRLSKPVSDAVTRYDRNHPALRRRVLIPIGQGLKKVWLNFIDPATMFCTCMGLLVIAYTHKKKAERLEAANKKTAEMEEIILRKEKELEEMKKKHAEWLRRLRRIDDRMKILFSHEFHMKQTPGMDAVPK